MIGAAAPHVSQEPASFTGWIEANQRYLCVEFARIKTLLASRSNGVPVGDAETTRAAIAEARAGMSRDPAIDVVTTRFGLTSFERDVLLLAAGVEMNPEIARACAATTGGTATFGMALATLPAPHWSAVTRTRPLRRWRLIDVADGSSITTSPIAIDEQVLHYLAGVDVHDARLEFLLRLRVPAAPIAQSHREIADAIARLWSQPRRRRPAVQLVGDDRNGQEDVAARAAARAGLLLHVLSFDDLPSSALERRSIASLWSREAALLNSALLVDAGASAASARVVADFVDAVATPTFVGTRDPITLRAESGRFTIDRPRPHERRALWRAVLGPVAGSIVETDLLFVGDQFGVGAQAIRRSGLAVRRAIEAGDEPGAALRAACRTFSRAAMDDLAQRIEPAASWDSLVVPEEALATLREIAVHLRHRGTVYEAWELGATCSRGVGLAALFAGETGTGKTMAAEVLASELGLDLYRIDLSRVVSKYIGETEKNLRRVFEAAEHGGAILLFDEADALFGKRSEVKDSHDRYANIEVSYLLQRMETYEGLAILTTNMKSALDRAFHRRLRFVVQFPFPDAAQRERIWRSVFPAATPVAALDYARLARLTIAGGTIRNIAINAAFRAAHASGPVTMEHIAHAARGEYAKQDRKLLDSEVGDWR